MKGFGRERNRKYKRTDVGKEKETKERRMGRKEWGRRQEVNE